MNLLLYNIFLFLYSIGIRVVSIANRKAGLWLKGRKNIFRDIEAWSSSSLKPAIWIHCASLGEFEQARPLIEKIKNDYPCYSIIITFFSPSGYEVIKDDPIADKIFYLPNDSKANAKKFIDLIDPVMVLWIKYEYWYYYLNELKQRGTQVFLISGIFRKDQPFFQWYGSLWIKMLDCFTHLFVQNDESAQLLLTVNRKNVTVSGDTRFDRVIAIRDNFHEVDGIREFCGESKVIVAGSTWEEDEILLIHYARTNPGVKIIIAPHEIDKENLEEIKKEFQNSTYYSEWMNGEERGETQCLIIDNVGMLSRLYNYADVAFVGGGFGDDGVHNVLEPAVYGKPVIFGPEYEKYYEASDLIECGGAIEVENALELEHHFNDLLSDSEKENKYGTASKRYVIEKKGATERIMRFIQEKRLLIK